ncbi:MAG: hypothetical protein WCJ87_11740 [Burkholderiales bacterium]
MDVVPEFAAGDIDEPAAFEKCSVWCTALALLGVVTRRRGRLGASEA